MSEHVPTTESDYAPFLTLYYEEEIMGEAYFLGLTQYFSEPHQRDKLSLLSQIERCVADAVRPLLDRHGLKPRSDEDLHAIGAEQTARYGGRSWHDFIEDVTVTFPRYIDEFAALVRLAPDNDRPLLEPFTAHEVAGIEFAERELKADPLSANALKSYIGTFQVQD